VNALARAPVASVITTLAAIVALAVTLILPLGYFAVVYNALKGELAKEAEVRSGMLSQFVGSNPDLWRFDRHHIEELLSRAPMLRPDQENRLLTSDGQLMAHMGTTPPSPHLVYPIGVFDSGERVGELQIIRSTRPLWRQAGIAALIGLLLGGLVFFVLRVLPLRALRAALDALNAEVSSHAQARRDAEAANRAKSQFLAAASHDLRQPLHALGLYAAVLEEKVNQPEVRELTRSINSSVDALENLFSAIMDISKLDAGVLEPSVSAFPIDAILERVRAEFGPPAAAKGLELRVHTCRRAVRSDPVLLQRIVNNLVANAVRYTDLGGIMVCCRRRGENVSVEVWDTGIGISRDELPRVFEEFYQVGNRERDRSKGLGLGLAIVRRLAELLGHSIEVRSRIGRGSYFAVVVAGDPAYDAADRQQRPPSQTHLDGKVVVVIDDEPAVRDGMGILLRQWGCEPITSASLEEAQSELGRRGLTPDGVIADYRLRESVGTTAIRELRLRYGEDLPAAIITGDIGAERLAEFAASGYRHLHKPVPPAELRALLDELLTES
jgi:signal transduction histidine kinase